MKNFYLRSQKFRELLHQTFPHQLPNGLTFASGKGGVGKTLLAANFAFCFAERGIRTLLIDGDSGLANLDIALGVNVKKTLEDVLKGQIPFDEALVATRYPHLTLLPCSSGFLQEAPYQSFENIRSLEKEFTRWDLVIIDAPAGIQSLATHWSHLTRWTTLIVNSDKTSLTDAYAFMKVLKKQNYQGVFQMIANQIPNQEEGLQIFEILANVAHEFLGLSLGFLGSVPEDEKMKTCLNQRILCASLHPFAPSSQGIRNLVASFCAMLEKDSETPRHVFSHDAQGIMQFTGK